MAISGPDLEKKLLEAGEPPTMPHIAVKLLDLLSDPEFSTAALARIIRSDTGLATRILRIANSAFYGCPREVASLDRAVLMLGSRTVKNLVLAASTREIHGDQGLIDRLLWEHAVAMAIGCHLIASRFKVPHHEDALVCGLLQNIGQVVMKKLFPEEFADAMTACYNNDLTYEAVEQMHFGFSHYEVGAYMVRTWRLAESVELVIAHQGHFKALREASPEHAALGAVVEVVGAFARQLGLGERVPAPDVDPAGCEGARFLGLDVGTCNQLAVELVERHEAEKEYFS